MKKVSFKSAILFILLLISANLLSQNSLKIESIMKGDLFTGFSPENIQWSPDAKSIYFSWNPDMELFRSQYFITTGKLKPVKLTMEEKKSLPSFNCTYNKARTEIVYSKDGDIFLLFLNTGKVTQITSTLANENNPEFSKNEDKIIYSSSNNLYSWNILTGTTSQITDFRPGKEKQEELPYSNERDKWLYDSEMYLIKTLVERKEKRDIANKEGDSLKPERPKVIYTGKDMSRSIALTPDENYLTWQSFQLSEDKRTIVANYVTESAYTEDVPSRSKVGMNFTSAGNLNIFDIKRDTIYQVNTSDIPGLKDLPDYSADYPAKNPIKPKDRNVSIGNPVWADDGSAAVVDIYSDDNKDRWIMLLDIKSGGLKLLDRQHDNAWIDGPGIGYGAVLGWLADNKTIFFQSEESGYSHLYLLDITKGQKKALTSGSFEIYDLTLSNDKKTWYFISNETNNGIRELYKMSVQGGQRIKLTAFGGGVEYIISPDERYFALRVSGANHPWELYLLENKEKAVPQKVTESTTESFRAYNWKVPEFISIKASDGKMVPARLYKSSKQVKNGPAVIFVHGAGYLQNAHRWWSDYSHEYMFHNFLVDNGYTVLDIDYRGSAGYGRDWRTAIYRFMGGKDLDDQVDGAKYLVEQQQVDPQKIGIYGGSYGGFITLMAMFTKPGTFAAGAALRAVTDWAHYNHGYTSNILNTPRADSIAYVKSSPIYYAEGLKGALLICHGMIDDNVHFQDVVRLNQRLIELGKNNWQMAVYPLERHGFVEPSSWTDEYKRIYKLFEDNLK